MDDLAVAGPQAEMAHFWKEMGSKDGFKIGAFSELKDFLGIRVHRYEDQDHRCCHLDMNDYSKMTVNKYCELWEVKENTLHAVQTPMQVELRHDAVTSVPVNRVQKMIGMLLWLARCGRPDISFAVSRLGSKVSKWDTLCEIQLNRLKK